jgi:ribokinase
VLYRTSCGEQGIGVEGVVSIPDGATPLCFLVYQPDGSCGCLIDFGMSGQVAITREQERLIAAAELVCFTVGPAAASMRAMELIRPEATVAWIMKNDPASFIPPLREKLAQRAQFIFCNARERAWVDEVTGDRPADQVIIQTGGAEAVQIHQSGSVTNLAVNALTMHDTTGAGDTLAGGTLAAILRGETDIVSAVREGIDAAYKLLSGRRDA